MRVVMCNCPPAKAAEIARALVEERLAACVNVVPGVVSFYRWQGSLCEDAESTLWIKTADDRFEALRDRLTELHPYTVPEIVALPVVDVNAAYAAWVEENSR